jgi:hypothetical protein
VAARGMREKEAERFSRRFAIIKIRGVESAAFSFSFCACISPWMRMDEGRSYCVITNLLNVMLFSCSLMLLFARLFITYLLVKCKFMGARWGVRRWPRTKRPERNGRRQKYGRIWIILL